MLRKTIEYIDVKFQELFSKQKYLISNNGKFIITYSFNNGKVRSRILQIKK